MEHKDDLLLPYARRTLPHQGSFLPYQRLFPQIEHPRTFKVRMTRLPRNLGTYIQHMHHYMHDENIAHTPFSAQNT
jgi:hypothetical protein